MWEPPGEPLRSQQRVAGSYRRKLLVLGWWPTSIRQTALPMSARALLRAWQRDRLALGLTKHALNMSLSNDLRAQLALEADMQQLASETDDFQEGIAAFREKGPQNSAATRHRASFCPHDMEWWRRREPNSHLISPLQPAGRRSLPLKGDRGP